MATALLLEDQPLIAMDLESTLESAGFDVVSMRSCAEADAWLEGNRAAVAVVDMHLVDGSCHNVAARLHRMDIPFIVHSGDRPSDHADTPFALGTWMGKPAPPNELIETALRLAAG